MADGPLSILLASSEVAGFAKTGGLADVCAALPRALAARGHRVAVVMPLYRCVRDGGVERKLLPLSLAVPVGDRVVSGRLFEATLPHSDVPVYLVEQPHYFERDDPLFGRTIYTYTTPQGWKSSYPDEAERWVFFCRAVLEALPGLPHRPRILHCNDWQTGLVPVYLEEVYRRRPGCDDLRSLLTIHNLAYQGNFPRDAWWLTNLTDWIVNERQVEFYHQVSFLKGGIVFANLLSTVSPTYAQEMQTRAFGYGLEGVLADRKERLRGIVNGADYQVWDPTADDYLPAHYNADTAPAGKAACKSALQHELGLPQWPRTPVLGVVARLAEQKGIDLILGAAEFFLRQDTQLVVLGEGEPYYQRKLQELQQRFPGKVGLALFFDERLAHLIEAGADLFLMPSRYEPSGLNQLYSLRYGTVPVVRAVGGLVDTITDATAETYAAGTATGFRFGPFTVGAFQAALQRALDTYRNAPERWRQLQRTGMAQDWSWDRSAAEYERLYKDLLALW